MMKLFEKLSVHKDFDAVGWGEVMLRLSPQINERIGQGTTFEKHSGGSELNVMAGISLLGRHTGIITKMPQNIISGYVKNRIRFRGVSDDFIIFDETPGSRLGVYYYEGGSYPKKPTVVYDRAGSAFTTMSLDEIPQGAYASTRVFHTSGISLALSEHMRKLGIEMLRRFHEAGAVISFDCNYRANLWDEDTARETICSILPMVDILFVSEETSRRMMQRKGTLEEIQRGYCEQYGIDIVCSTARKVNSPKSHTFSSTIYCAQENKSYTEHAYENIEVIDRIGSGDAYVAGVLYGLLTGTDIQRALSFGDAMSAMKNTVSGDMPDCTLREIEGLIREHVSGTTSEMNR